MSLKVFDKPDMDKWNSIVEQSLPCSAFHHWEWLEIAAKHSNTRLYPLVFEDKGGYPLAIFPIFYSKKGPLKMVFSPPPGCGMRLGPAFVKNGSKTYKRETVYREFQSETEAFISRLGANYILIETCPDLKDVRPFIWSGYHAEPVYHYGIELTSGQEEVWAGFKAELRNDVRRTQRAGVEVTMGKSERSIDYLYESVDRRYGEQGRRLGVTNRYFLDLFDHGDQLNLVLFVASYEGKMVGAIAHIAERDRLSAWVGAVKSGIPGLAVNDLIQWEAIRWAIEHGYQEYEMIGANTPRLCAFKSKYSPDLKICFSLRKAGRLGHLAENGYRFLRKRGN